MQSLRGDKAAKAEAETSDDDHDDDDADEEEEVEQDGLKAFKEIEGECKLVLIVRTDLGMNKGSSPLTPFPSNFHIHTITKQNPLFRRQNRRPSLPRHVIQLQSPHLKRTASLAVTAVGIHRASENRSAGKFRRAA